MDRELLLSKVIFLVGMCLFGALVHVSNAFAKARKAGVPFKISDGFVLGITATFSGIMFGLCAVILSENQIHHLIAVGTGSFLGLSGLSRLTDILIAVIVKGRQ